MSFDFRSVQKATKADAIKRRRLPAEELAFELAIGVLRLSLSPERTPIDQASIQAISPCLAEAYQHAHSTIPTYLGLGRSGDGLALHRKSTGPYPSCRENAALALQRLQELGYEPAVVAAMLSITEETMLVTLGNLPHLEAASAELKHKNKAAKAAAKAAAILETARANTKAMVIEPDPEMEADIDAILEEYGQRTKQ